MAAPKPGGEERPPAPLSAAPSADDLPEGVRAYFRDQPSVVTGRPGLFLDRDGVVVEEVGYLHQVEKLTIHAGAAALIRAANTAGAAVVIVTNQSGIDRDLYTWDDYDVIDTEILARLGSQDAFVDARIANGFHPRFTDPWGDTHEFWRKPGPGMLLHAIERLTLAPERSWMVGDMASDVQAALAAGLAGAFHMKSVHGPEHRERALALASGQFEVHGVQSLEAVQTVISERQLFTNF
ncbi:MAG: HAD-IIIA family hydrolase [Alphaproteobacteria bacterium]|jgi:D-glycero-D-manno-heptose 1,7-bisphosphate phosphatase|nr:HAD-IIIA family hydrolase [Alphaproteobacteria bacterium]MBT4710844.1 HAD-IIIA family hydrolase [Alphaproteobacteria bacterium]MBT5859668.1 HAD-IIIA family hydrolase [Alphaproteobacteria bacterium]